MNRDLVGGLLKSQVTARVKHLGTRLVLVLFLLALPLMFTGTLTLPARSAPVSEPCCGIIAINATTGIVTARDIKTGRTFQFEVDSRSLLRKLKVGQKVWADQRTKKVSVDEADPCCTIVGGSKLETADVPMPDYGDPCCLIVGVDNARGVVTARDTTTARTFQFKADALDSGSLKVGDAVAADVAGGRLISIKGAARTNAVIEPDNADPCCLIVSIKPDIQTYGGDVCCPIVTVRNNATGRTFQFKGSAAVKNSLKVGQAVSIDATGNWAFVQSSATSGLKGRPSTYSYPVKGAAENIDTSGVLESAAKRWVFSPGLKPSSIGRIVVQVFDKARNAFTTRIFNPAEKTGQLAGSYQGGAFDLVPGQYDVDLSGARVTGVPVQRGMDTRILAGMLNVTVDTTWNLYDETKTTKVNGGHRGKKIALPVGKYYIRVGRFAEVIIKDGQVTDF